MNTTIKTGLAAILLLAFACKKESAKNSAILSNQAVANSVAAHYIGEHYGGGIIFYVDTTGQHGLIADTVDLPKSEWWNGVVTTTGATSRHLGTGYSNTRKIILSQGDSGHYAARRCWHHNGSGYTDWFLPSKDELNELYKQRNVVGHLLLYYYWSSTERANHNSGGAWVVDFISGASYILGKNVLCNVRAVRAF